MYVIYTTTEYTYINIPYTYINKCIHTYIYIHICIILHHKQIKQRLKKRERQILMLITLYALEIL